MGLKPSPLANNYTREPVEQERYPLDLMQCSRCDHVQLGVVVDPKVLYSDYRYKSGASEWFKSHLEEMAEELSALVPGGFVVEIASNDGTLLNAFERRGHLALGVDPAGVGSNCIKAFFSETTAAKFEKKADLIVANNVLAHVDDLSGVIRGVKRLLAEDGLFVFEVQYLPDLIKNNRFDLIYHEHLDYHHLAPLRPFLEREGLSIEEVSHNESQGGSVRVFCVHRRNSRVKVHKEDIDLTKLSIPSNPVEGLTGVIAAYGACAKTTGFICQTGAKFDFIMDDNPLKQGLYAPTGEKIVAPKDADHIYLAAWNFAEEIRAKHPGSNFIR